MADRRMHILIVEDEEAHIELVLRAFARRADKAKLTVARTLAEAREVFRETPPDLAIVDLVLPDGEGTELLPPRAGEPIPVVVMTAHGNERAAVEAIRRGVLDYVVKSGPILADMPHIAEQALRQWRHLAETRRLQAERIEYQERLRALASELVAAEERERRRIATGLHDGLCQALALAKMKLQSLRAHQPSPADAAQLDQVVRTLDGCIEEAGTLAFDLSPPILFELGLTAAAEWLLENVRKQHGLRCRLDSKGEVTGLGDELRSSLYRSLKELLANAVKHARADEVRVHVENADGAIRLTVDDDGVGCDPVPGGPMLRGRGFGLLSIQEQVGRFGGELVLQGSPLGGTRAVVRVPLSGCRQEGNSSDGD